MAINGTSINSGSLPTPNKSISIFLTIKDFELTYPI